METENKEKIKNLLSIIILLGGLFIGSLFVDVAQIIKGSGFSVKNLNKSDIFEANNKTWVAYSDPVVETQVISDDTCEKCDSSEILVWLRRVLPTISAEKVAFDSPAGKDLIKKFGITTLPAIIFKSNISETELYSQAQELFELKNESYILKTQELGLIPGKYLNIPNISEGDAVLGNADSKVRIIVFSDFQCPFCKSAWSVLRATEKTYKDKVYFAYKQLPLSNHAQANNAALAANCALEQDKFWEYGDKLYGLQSEWSKKEGTQKFKDYAKNLKLNSEQFNQCLDDKKYQDKVDANKKEAENIGVLTTPAIFINNQFKNGVVGIKELKNIIEEELVK